MQTKIRNEKTFMILVLSILAAFFNEVWGQFNLYEDPSFYMKDCIYVEDSVVGKSHFEVVKIYSQHYVGSTLPFGEDTASFVKGIIIENICKCPDTMTISHSLLDNLVYLRISCNTFLKWETDGKKVLPELRTLSMGFDRNIDYWEFLHLTPNLNYLALSDLWNTEVIDLQFLDSLKELHLFGMEFEHFGLHLPSSIESYTTDFAIPTNFSTLKNLKVVYNYGPSVPLPDDFPYGQIKALKWNWSNVPEEQKKKVLENKIILPNTHAWEFKGEIPYDYPVLNQSNKRQ